MAYVMCISYLCSDLGSSDLLGRPVMFISDRHGPDAERAVAMLAPGDIAILENTRFEKGEEKNDPALADAVARLGDFYVNDAFSAAHRAHMSTAGLAHRDRKNVV